MKFLANASSNISSDRIVPFSYSIRKMDPRHWLHILLMIHNGEVGIHLDSK